VLYDPDASIEKFFRFKNACSSNELQARCVF
jgi:hypothetical protein